MRKYKLAILSSHPIQYKAPFFRELEKHPQIDLMVYFCSDQGVEKQYDPEFGISLCWDIPLLDGYDYRYLKNVSPYTSSTSFGKINPGIIKQLVKNKYDAIWINGYAIVTPWLAFLGAKMTNTRLIFRGEADLLVPNSFIKRTLKKIVLTSFFKNIDVFLYSYTRNADYYRHYGVPDEKLFFCPSAIDNDWFWKQEQISQNSEYNQKEKLEIPLESPVILFVAKLIPRKRPMELLCAFERVRTEFNASLVYIGEGSERKRLETYIEDKDLERVYLVGFQNQSKLANYYSMADLFVLSSERDPSPKALNEALAFGLPVIVTDRVGTAQDLIQEGENGFIYPLGNVNALVESLRKLLSDPELTKRMGICSRQIATQWSFTQGVKGVLAALNYVKGEN